MSSTTHTISRVLVALCTEQGIPLETFHRRTRALSARGSVADLSLIDLTEIAAVFAIPRWELVRRLDAYETREAGFRSPFALALYQLQQDRGINADTFHARTGFDPNDPRPYIAPSLADFTQIAAALDLPRWEVAKLFDEAASAVEC